MVVHSAEGLRWRYKENNNTRDKTSHFSGESPRNSVQGERRQKIKVPHRLTLVLIFVFSNINFKTESK